jgi:fluoroacetyl-CoA thioesterase
MTLEDLRVGLRHSATMTVGEALTVPAQAQLFDPATEMPPVLATANMIAFVEWTCVWALAPYLAPEQRTVGTKVEMTHTAATPIGMQVTAEVELVAVAGRTLRFKVACRDDKEPIGEGFHERTVVDNGRFMGRLARKAVTRVADPVVIVPQLF